MGVTGETELSHLQLVSLGMNLWSDESGGGADIVFADPKTQTTMILKEDWKLSKTNWGTLTSKLIAGRQIKLLGASQVTTKGAVRKANGAIKISGKKAMTDIFPLSAKSWDYLNKPLKHDSVKSLVEYISTSNPEFAKENHLLKSFYLLSGKILVEDFGFDPGSQTLYATVTLNDEPFIMALPHRAISPHAVDLAAEILNGKHSEISGISGNVSLVDGKIFIEPLAIMTESRGFVLQAEETEKVSIESLYEPSSESDFNQLTKEVLNFLSDIVVRGVKNQGFSLKSRISELIDILKNSGFELISNELSEISKKLQEPKVNYHLLLSSFTLLIFELQKSTNNE